MLPSDILRRAGKGWPYEGGIRTPWIIRARALRNRVASASTPVITNDLYPTLLELAGLPLAPSQHVDGISLVAALKGEPLERGTPLFWHYPHYGNQGGAPCGAVRDGDWKLIEWFEDGSLELFNLRDDPGERKNLAAQNPEKTRRCTRSLSRRRTERHIALMPTPNP